MQESTSREIVVIVNPKARGGWVGKNWPTIEPILASELGRFTAAFTTRSGEGRDLAAGALARGAGLVLAMGGDGTASEVVSGFMDAQGGPYTAVQQPAAFGYLPCGSGGDLRRTPGSPTDLKEAARAVRKATPRPIDVGRFEYVDNGGQPAKGYFVNIASFGIGGLVDRYVNQSRKLFGGPAAFLAASFRATFAYKNQRIALRLDDGPEEELRIYNVGVANGRYQGGGMMMAPEALLDDGLFDVVTLGDLTFAEAVLLSGKVYQGKHIGRPKIQMRRARSVSARPLTEGAAVLLDIDGETPGRLPATFHVVDKAILLQV